MYKEKLIEMVAGRKTLDQMSMELGKSVSCVRYWLKRHSITRESSCKTWTNQQMIEAIRSSVTVADVLRCLGLQVRPGNYETVRRFAMTNGIDLSHIKGKSCGKGGQRKRLADVMVKDSTYCRGSLKKKLLRMGLLKNICSDCGLSETWNGKPIVMVLDHINGDNCDHRMENLRMLCPNCNSQQRTFCNKAKHGKAVPKSRDGKGKCVRCGKAIWEESERCQECAGLKCRKVDRPSAEELGKMINRLSWAEIGRRYSVSDNAVRKWANSYGLA